MNEYDDKICINELNKLYFSSISLILEHSINVSEIGITIMEAGIDYDSSLVIYENAENTIFERIRDFIKDIFDKIKEFFKKITKYISDNFDKMELERIEADVKNNKKQIEFQKNPEKVMSIRQKAILDLQNLISKLKSGKHVSDDEIDEVEEKKKSAIAKVVPLAIISTAAVGYISKYMKVKEFTERNIDNAHKRALEACNSQFSESEYGNAQHSEKVEDLLDSKNELMRKNMRIINLMSRTFIEMGNDIRLLFSTIKLALSIRSLSKLSDDDFDES